MGNPLAVSVPTKVSQNWFPESETLLATGVLAMSMPLGIVLGQLGSPLIVKTADQVPIMNIVWFVPSAITMVCCILFIKTSYPPSPPSKSAELAGQKDRKSFRCADLHFHELCQIFFQGISIKHGSRLQEWSLYGSFCCHWWCCRVL